MQINYKETIRVAVTSTSVHKTGAVEAALRELFPQAQIEVSGFKSRSGVNEQPVNNEAEQGAYNRIVSILEVLVDEVPNFGVTQLIVSIESGIFQNGDVWEDKAVVIVANPSLNIKVTEISEGVVFPNEYVNVAQRRGFGEHTVGSVIAEMNPDVDGTDPHAFLTKDLENPISRQELLESTVLRALVKYFETNT